MSDEKTSKSGKTWLYVVGIVLSLPLLYILSVGPAFVLAARGMIPMWTVEFVYLPLERFAEVTGTDSSVQTYVSAWFGLTGTSLR